MTATTPAAIAPLAGRRRWIALAFLALGVAMIILDATVVNVAIPTMVRDLDLTTSDAEWVNVAYSLTFASLLILSGRLADRFGRKRLFQLGVVVFVGSSVLVAASASAAALIGARAVQGVGAAMILPASLAVLNSVFTGKARAIAFAAWGATIGGMAALGPLVGGWLTTNASWHWAFLINVPIGLMVLIGVLLVVPETRDPKAAEQGNDWAGIVLVTTGLLGLVFALIEGQRYGWIIATQDLAIGGFVLAEGGISIVPIAALLGLASLISAIVVEGRRQRAGKVVLIDLTLFRIRTFGAGNLVALVVSLGEFGLLFSLPLFLQSVRSYDALQTGVILLALAIGSFLASGVGAGLSQRIGPVMVLRIGMVLEVAGIVGLGVVLSTEVTGWGLAPWLFVYGLGVGFATAQLTGVILSEIPVEESGGASALQSTARQVGAAIGTAILGTTLIVGLSSGVSSSLEERGVPTEVAVQVGDTMSQSAGQALPALASQADGQVLVEGASDGFVDAMRLVAWTASTFVFLGLLATFFLPRNAARIESEGYEPPRHEPTPSAG